MTEQFLVEIFVKTFLSVKEIIIWLAVIIKVLRILGVLTLGRREDWTGVRLQSSLPSSGLCLLTAPVKPPPGHMGLAYLMLL